MNHKAWWNKSEKDRKRREFRWRQAQLIGSAAIFFVGAFSSGYVVFLAVAVLLIKTASVEALRFRKAGTTIQTMRCIWRGSTPEDVRARKFI